MFLAMALQFSSDIFEKRRIAKYSTVMPLQLDLESPLALILLCATRFIKQLFAIKLKRTV